MAVQKLYREDDFFPITPYLLLQNLGKVNIILILDETFTTLKKPDGWNK